MRVAVAMALSTFVRTVLFVSRKTAGSVVYSPRRLSRVVGVRVAVVMVLSTFVRTVFFVSRKTAGSAVCSPRRLSVLLLTRVVVASRGRPLPLLWQIFLRPIKDVRMS